MTNFEFFFTFYGLILGLSVVELVGGAARMVDEGHRLKVGWVTPLLATFLALDVTTFWGTSWMLFREAPSSYAVFVLALVISALYYLATYLVFPHDPKDGENLDEHYWARRRLILSSVVLANFLVFCAGMTLVAGNNIAVPTRAWVAMGLFFLTGIAAIVLPRGRLAVTALVMLLSTSVVSLVGSSAALLSGPAWAMTKHNADRSNAPR